MHATNFVLLTEAFLLEPRARALPAPRPFGLPNLASSLGGKASFVLELADSVALKQHARSMCTSDPDRSFAAHASFCSLELGTAWSVTPWP